MKNPTTPLFFALMLAAAAAHAAPVPPENENIPAPEVGGTNSMGGKVYPDDFVGPLMPNDCRAGSCTPPDIGACGPDSSFDFMSAFNPPEGTKWADPNCTRVPCAVEPTKEEAKAVENKPLPNGDSVTTFADGTVSYTSNGQTSARMTPEELEASNARYKEALAAAKKDAEMFKGNSNGTTASNGEKKSAGGGSSERSSGGGDNQLGGGTLDGFSVGQDLGNEMGSLYAGNGRNGGGNDPSGLDGSGGGPGGAGNSVPEIEVVAGQTGDIELTYERNILNQQRFAGFADEAARLVEDAQRQVSAASSDPSGGSVNTMQIGANKK